MKRIIAFLMIFTLLLACCACGETSADPTDAVSSGSENVTPADVADTQAVSDGDAETQNTEVGTTAKAEASGNLPALEDYTLIAEQTKNKNNFVFAGTKEAVQTCDKIVIINSDGTTEMSFSFAEDGSGMTMQSIQADGNKYTTLIEFDEQGRVTGVFNGSGTYSTYEYADNTCLLQAFDAEGALQDQRTYFYDENERTQRIERGDGDGVYEKYFYTYNEDGTTASLRVENESGYVVYTHTYDDNENLISTRIDQNDAFYALQKFTYDENGHRLTQEVRRDENAPNMLDMSLAYANEYAEDGLYLGTVETEAATKKVYVSAAYGYVITQYPHYATFIKDHFMTY